MRRLLMIFCLAGCLTASVQAAEPQPEIRVMSFNIRYGTAKDGPNHWEQRKEFLAETIQAFAPDLLGTQETLKFQKEFLDRQLTDYQSFGVGRQDGRNRGEMTAVYFLKRRFKQLDGGHFWLSETPDVVGSKSWDSALMRMVTWVKLRDRQAEGTPVLWFFNTHFDHRGSQARLESAKLLRARILEIAGDDPVILTGDFNAAVDSQPYTALYKPHDDGSPLLIDAYRAHHPAGNQPEGTFNNFDPMAITGKRIDWIALSNGWRILSVEIDRTARDGRVPSDHFPVTARLQYAR